MAVLCYHRFEPGKGELIINPAEFEAEMKKIKDAHVNVIPMHDFLAWRRGEKSIPSRSVIISLDDGWISGYEVAWPILKKYGYPFTMFIYTDYVRGGPKSGGKSMSWDQLGEMRDAGVDIECHTVTHSDLRRSKRGKTAEQYADYLKNELVNSKDIIETNLAIKVLAIAYPYGNYSTEVEEMCKTAGYEAAFTVNPQKRSRIHRRPYTLGRYAIDGLTPKVFDAAIDFGAGTSGPSPDEVAPMAAASHAHQARRRRDRSYGDTGDRGEPASARESRSQERGDADQRIRHRAREVRPRNGPHPLPDSHQAASKNVHRDRARHGKR